MKKYLSGTIYLLIFGLIVSCGEDEEELSNNADFIAKATATVTIQGTSYEQAEGFASSYFELEFDGETDRSITLTVANGTDTADVSISFATNTPLEVATYSKAINGEDFGLTCTLNDEVFRSEVLGQEEDNTDYTINITSVEENLISGNFSGSLQTFFADSVITVSGDFVAVDAAIVLGESLF